MVITVTPGAQSPVTLDEPDDFTRFHVAVGGGRDRSRLADALALSGAGVAHGDDVLVRVAWVRTAAAGRAAPDWEEGFAGMLDFARRKGWLDERGDAVRAHVEWDVDQ